MMFNGACLVPLLLCATLCLQIVFAQIDTYYPQPSIPYNTYNVPNPGDRDYRTYTYNSRRYGQYLPNSYSDRTHPGDPNVAGQDVRFTYDRVGGFKYLVGLNLDLFCFFCRRIMRSQFYQEF